MKPSSQRQRMKAKQLRYLLLALLWLTMETIMFLAILNTLMVVLNIPMMDYCLRHLMANNTLNVSKLSNFTAGVLTPCLVFIGSIYSPVWTITVSAEVSFFKWGSGTKCYRTIHCQLLFLGSCGLSGSMVPEKSHIQNWKCSSRYWNCLPGWCGPSIERAGTGYGWDTYQKPQGAHWCKLWLQTRNPRSLRSQKKKMLHLPEGQKGEEIIISKP